MKQCKQKILKTQCKQMILNTPRQRKKNKILRSKVIAEEFKKQ